MENVPGRTYQKIMTWLEDDPGNAQLLALLAAYHHDRGDTEQARKVERDADIAQGVRHVQCKRQSLEKEHRERLKDLDNQMQNLRKACTHTASKRYPDASGNNDSTTICLCCGKHL